MRIAGLLCACWIMSVVAASGQDSYAMGLGGVTSGETETGSVVGGEIAVAVHPNVTIYGAAGWLENVLPKSVQRSLDESAERLTRFTDSPFAFDGTASTLHGSGGVRIQAAAGAVRPYAAFGAGLGYVRVKVVDPRIGELPSAGITDDTRLEDWWGDEDDFRGTKPLVEAGGGIAVFLGRVYVDVGYRFTKIFELNDLQFSRVHGGIGVAF